MTVPHREIWRVVADLLAILLPFVVVAFLFAFLSEWLDDLNMFAPSMVAGFLAGLVLFCGILLVINFFVENND